jgi:hypothetical protein
MKKVNSHRSSRESGQGLVVVIILLAIIGAGFWYLFNSKKTMDREARAFGREMIERLVVRHDQNFFADVSPQMRLDYPPLRQKDVIDQVTQLGVPQQPINIEEIVTFQSTFFSPHGHFTAHLFYPTSAGTIELDVSHPVGKWQVDNLTFVQQ